MRRCISMLVLGVCVIAHAQTTQQQTQRETIEVTATKIAEDVTLVPASVTVIDGATSFVGVIHVIHREPGAPGLGYATIGTRGSLGIGATLPLSQRTNFRQSITANFDRQELRDDRTHWQRGHLLYRAASELA